MEHFSPFTYKSKALHKEAKLIGSEAFAKTSGLRDGQSITFSVDGVKFNRLFKIDTSMKGNIAINPSYDMGLSTALLSSYRFSHVDFAKSNNEEVGS